MGQIEQVLMNLAVNARDAMPQGGSLNISTDTLEDGEAGPFVRLTVSDSGVGIPSEHLPKIFEPFFTTKAAGEGSGLGLSTVYGIVEQSGGHVKVWSREGEGTSFQIFLPAVEGLPSEPGMREERGKDSPGGNETVLVVEDEAGVRQLVRRILSDKGYTVLAVPDGDQALAVAEAIETPIDLLVSDLVLPGMGGRELASRLTARYPRLKVLFMSGYEHGDGSGPQTPDPLEPFVRKPFNPGAFSAKVREILDG
jgi:CheY-like chemotaxis protein